MTPSSKIARVPALDDPPVSVAFIDERCRTLVAECTETSEVYVDVYLCRDKRELLHRVFKRGSLVVVGGKKRWWRTPEEKLANMLRSDGHHVIFADLRLVRVSRSELMKDAAECDRRHCYLGSAD